MKHNAAEFLPKGVDDTFTYIHSHFPKKTIDARDKKNTNKLANVIFKSMIPMIRSRTFQKTCKHVKTGPKSILKSKHGQNVFKQIAKYKLETFKDEIPKEDYNRLMANI